MARQPYNVLVYPYRPAGAATFEYAVLRRSDKGFWQGISGGGEDGETPLQTAKRESWEEAGIPPTQPFIQLDTVEPVRVTEFSSSVLWSESVYVIPQYCFGVLTAGHEITLSHEHTAFCWLPFEQAESLLRYDGNKTALWELNQRLKGRGPRG
jgi:dATP pyrophosphohydrolase